MDEDAFAPVFKGCWGLLHVASVVANKSPDPMDARPAVEGTKHVLKLHPKHPQSNTLWLRLQSHPYPRTRLRWRRRSRAAISRYTLKMIGTMFPRSRTGRIRTAKQWLSALETNSTKPKSQSLQCNHSFSYGHWTAAEQARNIVQ